MSRWDDILSNAAGYAGAATAVGSRVFDLINTGKNSGVSTTGLVRDINTNGFLATESIYKPEYFVRAFDEPTYLTFKLEFMFHNPRNVLYTNKVMDVANGKTSTFDDDMEKAYDFLPEAFLQDSMLAQNDNSATLGPSSPSYSPEIYDLTMQTHERANDFTGYYYSAEDYLGLNRGEYGRARLMRKIKYILHDLQDNFPYYFKSIDGLDKLNAINPKNGFRVADDVILTIKCYEGLDLKITQLIQMIRKVTWDDMYQRWVLPDIMRYFGMRIYVSEIRTFHEITRNTITHPFKKIPKLTVYNYADDRDGEPRNATEAGRARSIYRKIMNITGGILTAAEALGGRFFSGTGYQNVVDNISNTFSTVSDISSSLAQMYQLMCVSALNEVMPTICYECHLCEFDITNTMSDINALHSTSKEPQEQTIRIKVRQVEDFQVYPLDRNLTVNSDETGYAIDNRIYGMTDDANSEDDSVYAQKRAEGFTGSTVFADRIFAKTFNGAMRNMYEKAKNNDNGVESTKLYRNLASIYDQAVNTYFKDRGFNGIGGNMPDGIFPRTKMYPGKKAQELMHSELGALRYKRNSLDVTENVMTLLVTGLNLAGEISSATGNQNSMSRFSRATSITPEDIQSELPRIYEATVALRDTVQQLQESDFGNTEMGQYELLNNLAYSKATQYTPMGAVASAVLGGL